MSQQPRDIRVEMRVRNNLLLTAMENKGINSIAELCRQMDALKSYGLITKLASMKCAARKKDGDWQLIVLRLSDFFQCMPEDLFSDPQQFNTLEKNRAHAEVSYTELQQLLVRRQEPITPELSMQADQLRSVIGEMLNTVTPREERVLRLRFGFATGEEMTLDQIAEDVCVSRERVRQILSKALRKLKHPSRSEKIGAMACIIREDKGQGRGLIEKRIFDEFDEGVLSSL